MVILVERTKQRTFDPQEPLRAATSMQVSASEMPASISRFRNTILLSIVELGYRQGIEGIENYVNPSFPVRICGFGILDCSEVESRRPFR